jgi:hypothetical protein
MALKSKDIYRSAKIRSWIILVAVLSLVASGCRVTYSFSGVNTGKAQTVSVQYFQNRASLVQPGLSQVLTDALIDKCKSQTKLSIVNGTGDVNFDGEIADYSTKPLTVSADFKAAMNRFTISVKVKYTNSLEPDLSFEQTFSHYEDYDSNLDLSAVEQDLSSKILDLIVEDIFNQAFVNW